jgi:hypothetical protein
MLIFYVGKDPREIAGGDPLAELLETDVKVMVAKACHV